MKRWLGIVVVSLTVIISVGCASGSNRIPPSTIPIDNPDSQPSLSPATSPPAPECPPDRTFLDALAAGLPYDQAVIAHQAYGAESSLLVWLVSPSTLQSTVGENQAEAEQQAITAARLLSDASPCLESFDTLQMLIVDPQYRLMFSGSLRTIDLPNLQADQAGGGTELEQGGGRVDPPIEPAAGDDCTWPEASQKLVASFAELNLEAVFYFVRDAGGNNVYAQWSVPDLQTALTIPNFLPEIHSQISCLAPPASGISVLLTLPDGQSLLTGYQPIAEGQAFDSSTFTYTIIEQP